MNDAFLPGNGFDTYEEQDRVLMGLSGSVRSGVVFPEKKEESK